MGLTNTSVGKGAIDKGFLYGNSGADIVVALAGNPNVGKSTVFNGLTGMKQHTGNWAGKTVASAVGICKHGGTSLAMVDIPGTYSLMAHSKEEEVARDFICFGSPDVTVVVCDATCLERNMNLVLQIMEVSRRTVVCINLMDEARRKGISIDTALLSERLGVPVVGVVARKKKSLSLLLDEVERCAREEGKTRRVKYREDIERALEIVTPHIEKITSGALDARWVALRLLDGDESLSLELSRRLCIDVCNDESISSLLARADAYLRESGLWGDILKEAIASAVVLEAEAVCDGVVGYEKENYSAKDRKIDKALTGRALGYPVMVMLLACVFFITVWGANSISNVISSFLFYIQGLLSSALYGLGAPEWLHGVLILGIYRVLAWVVSVMLPPMAIFFPLFTLLEDSGYLPRIAYNLDKPFCRCSSCGKQALTMCMGFGCNAAGVVGCRIIDSPRERLLAILTNSFVPCNGKFPMLIALITIFFVGGSSAFSSVYAALILTAVILLSVALTFFGTWILSRTFLRGVPSSFTIELPPYRRPQVLRVLVRFLTGRYLFSDVRW